MYYIYLTYIYTCNNHIYMYYTYFYMGFIWILYKSY